MINNQFAFVYLEEDPQELVYSPLTCELCSETFTIPADWVRHIESHADASHCVPKKRKRIEVSINLEFE